LGPPAGPCGDSTSLADDASERLTAEATLRTLGPGATVRAEAPRTVARMHVENELVREETESRSTEHMLAGGALTRDEADRLEHHLQTNPSDLSARIRLLSSLMLRVSEPAIAERVRSHALWFIAHHPEEQVTKVICTPMLCHHVGDEADRAEARRLWNEHVARRGDEPVVLANAAAFFSAEDPARAVELKRRAVETEKRLDERRALTKDLALELARTSPDEALDLLRDLHATESNEAERFHLQMEIIGVALLAGDGDAAEGHALALLERTKRPPRDWNHGNGVNVAYEALGWIALDRGDVRAAARALVASSDIPEGSPHLPMAGDRPRLDLARDLLARGEREAVIEFLENAARFWNVRPRLQGWIEALRAGESTDLR
jgi:hypothetical protein